MRPTPDFCLSQPALPVIFLADLNTQIPPAQVDADLLRCWICFPGWLMLLVAAVNSFGSESAPARSSTGAGSPVTAVVNEYCVSCHDSEVKKGDLDLDSISNQDVTRHSDAWERVVRKLCARQMPPAGKKRPDERLYEATVAELTSALDRAAAQHPNPGRTETLRRLNRAEYQNAIRDLLALDIDAAALLPKDDVGRGFDNVEVGKLSPTLLNRYLSAAGGARGRRPGGETFRMKPDLTQEEHVEGLPLGTRGGTLLSYTFPREGE